MSDGLISGRGLPYEYSGTRCMPVGWPGIYFGRMIKVLGSMNLS